MTAANAHSSSSTSALDRTILVFKNMIESLLNAVFSLTRQAASLRSNVLAILFLLAWLLAVLSLFPAPEQRSALMQPLQEALLTGDSPGLVSAFINLLAQTFFSPVVLRHLLALCVPFWLMKRIAAIYLADIFEKEEMVARRFIERAAFGATYTSIRVREGKVVQDYHGSPIIEIGGPGYVVVELDSAVLFERPDGSVHVIGPTGGKRRGEVVEGFERIRACTDLRDVVSSQHVTVRSREGIPLTARDIQYAFSIYRGPDPVKTLQNPYPFDPAALESMVYRSTVPVKPGSPPDRKPEWKKPLPKGIYSSVSAELNLFAGARGLSEFLSSIGEPEVNSFRTREDELEKMGQQLAGRGDSPVAKPVPVGPFTNRSFVTRLFYGDAFKKRAAGKGFQMVWIGVGTWDTPAEIIPANHLEAWKISRENYQRGKPDELTRLRSEAYLAELLRLIQGMPISKFFVDQQHVPDEQLIETLMHEYQDRLEMARERYEHDGDEVPFTLLEAIRIIHELRGTKQHWVGVG